MNRISKQLKALWILLALVALAAPLSARPPARSLPGLVWHGAFERAILFGGETRRDSSSLRYYLNDAWQWDGKVWVQFYPDNPPPGRSGHAMVYDPWGERVIVFGGKYGFDPDDNDVTLLRNDTWELVGTSWKAITSSAAPPPRQQPAAAFDVEGNRMVLYGGYDAAGSAIHDTWVLSGSTWTQLPTTAQVNNPSMVHDPVRHRTLMLGSNSDGETVMYEFVGGTWEQRTPENLPECVRFGAMTFEKRFTRVVFQGGACYNSQPTVAETWVWHGEDWAKLEPVPTPGRVTGFGLANDPIRAETLMFGGVDFSERSATYIFRNNRWSFNFENWIPGGRSLFAFAADPDRGVIWLFGGLDDVGDLLNDLFMLRGGVWVRQITEGGPPFCFNPVGAYDRDRKRFVLMCDNAAVWEWDGEQWYDFSSADPQPGDRRFSSMVYDENLRKTILFGGFDEFNYLQDVWTWDGAKWTEIEIRAKDAPPPRGLPAMFYDPATKKTMIYGGIGRPTIEDAVKRYEDMWSFDGTKWTEVKPSNTPGPLYGPQTGWDPASGRIVMFGGKNGLELYVNAQWEWNGSNWSLVTADNAPSPRMNGRMAIDPVTGKLMLYGGYAGYYFSQLWSVENGIWSVHPYKSTRDAGRPTRRPSGSPGSTVERAPVETPDN